MNLRILILENSSVTGHALEASLLRTCSEVEEVVRLPECMRLAEALVDFRANVIFAPAESVIPEGLKNDWEELPVDQLTPPEGCCRMQEFEKVGIRVFLRFPLTPNEFAVQTSQFTNLQIPVPDDPVIAS